MTRVIYHMPGTRRSIEMDLEDTEFSQYKKGKTLKEPPEDAPIGYLEMIKYHKPVKAIKAEDLSKYTIYRGKYIADKWFYVEITPNMATFLSDKLQNYFDTSSKEDKALNTALAGKTMPNDTVEHIYEFCSDIYERRHKIKSQLAVMQYTAQFSEISL